MLNILISIIGIIITIFFIIGFHEFGHFITARLLNIKVLRFSIGFGKALRIWHDKKGTEYVLAAIPLGGYVKMLDETEGAVPKNELHLAFNRQPIYKKFLVVLAGPLFNFILAFGLYWLLFIVGFTTVIPLIGKVTPHSIAEKAGLKPQQEIISIDNRTTTSWMSVVIRLLEHTGDNTQISMTTRMLNINKMQEPKSQSLKIPAIQNSQINSVTQNSTTHNSHIKNPATQNSTIQNPQTHNPNSQNSAIQNHVLDLKNWHLDNLRPDPLNSLGIEPYEPEIPPVIGVIKLDSPAAKSHLQIGDKITAINHTPIHDWIAAITLISAHPNETMMFTIERQNKSLTIPVTIGSKSALFEPKHGFLGIAPDFILPPDLLRNNQYGVLQAMSHASNSVSDFIQLNFLMLEKMVTGKVSILSLGGPITIFEGAGNSLNNGILPFLSFIAFISIAIGVINILPIPGLDGGHILIYAIELIIRQPLSQRVQELMLRIGFILLIILAVQAIANDIMRI